MAFYLTLIVLILSQVGSLIELEVDSTLSSIQLPSAVLYRVITFISFMKENFLLTPSPHELILSSPNKL